MAFTGKEGESITLAQAVAWTGNYRTENPGETKAHFFGATCLEKIIKQTGCVGIRAYYAIDDNGQKQLILVGVTADEKDITSGLILDRSVLCPPYCDATSPLVGP